MRNMAAVREDAVRLVELGWSMVALASRVVVTITGVRGSGCISRKSGRA